MNNDNLPDVMANDVYNLLVAHCEARETNREFFVRWFVNESGNEWRFQGALGFGGKFWRTLGRWHVNYYREDETPEREAMYEAVNTALKDLMRFYLSPVASADDSAGG